MWLFRLKYIISNSIFYLKSYVFSGNVFIKKNKNFFSLSSSADHTKHKQNEKEKDSLFKHFLTWQIDQFLWCTTKFSFFCREKKQIWTFSIFFLLKNNWDDDWNQDDDDDDGEKKDAEKQKFFFLVHYF